jgi:DNA-directed RNA polymerase subunit M/transcription elongation factor TFIIS
MTHLRCSECGGDLRVIGKLLKCIKCGREKNYREEKKSHIHEVDMNDETKDMDIIME